MLGHGSPDAASSAAVWRTGVCSLASRSRTAADVHPNVDAIRALFGISWSGRARQAGRAAISREVTIPCSPNRSASRRRWPSWPSRAGNSLRRPGRCRHRGRAGPWRRLCPTHCGARRRRRRARCRRGAGRQRLRSIGRRWRRRGDRGTGWHGGRLLREPGGSRRRPAHRRLRREALWPAGRPGAQRRPGRLRELSTRPRRPSGIA